MHDTTPNTRPNDHDDKPVGPVLQKLLNFRDVSHSVNTALNRTLLTPNLLFRSGRPDEATALDRKLLAETYHLTTVLDLRTPSELSEQARKASSDSAADGLRVPGVTYRMVNFNGRAYSTALIRQLSYWNAARLFGLYAVGYRREAIGVMGANVMAQRGLIGLAEDSLKHCTAEVKATMEILAEEANYPILVHCTQGKDRTGLVVLLTLLLLDVPVEAIRTDYLRSEQELAAGREARLEEIRGIGLPEEFAGCPRDWVEMVTAWMEGEYGGARAYLRDHCGVAEEVMESVRRILLRQ